MPFASLQCWLQYLSLSTMQEQLACAHFFGPDIIRSSVRGLFGGQASEHGSLLRPGRERQPVSSVPKGKKYCVPLMGSESRLSSICKSLLLFTKSMSVVFTTSKSHAV